VTAAIPATARVLEGGHPVAVLAALRSSLPLGVMTLVTLIYYRSGTLALKLLSSPAQTARFATASTIGFALLMMPNAITTGLLPRLAATSRSRQPALVRRAVVAALMICATAGSSVALTAHPLLELLFGATYGQAAPALRVLALATILIGPTGVLGTALIAQGRLRPVYLQVGASLVVNLVVLAWLGPRHGAVGAALATLMCETLAFVVTGVACVRACPELLMPNSQGGWAGATKPGVS
jgi:O-antigen/teichoic acid export membrane protein